jgi:hypothetical protein
VCVFAAHSSTHDPTVCNYYDAAEIRERGEEREREREREREAGRLNIMMHVSGEELETSPHPYDSALLLLLMPINVSSTGPYVSEYV